MYPISGSNLCWGLILSEGRDEKVIQAIADAMRNTRK